MLTPSDVSSLSGKRAYEPGEAGDPISGAKRVCPPSRLLEPSSDVKGQPLNHDHSETLLRETPDEFVETISVQGRDMIIDKAAETDEVVGATQAPLEGSDDSDGASSESSALILRTGPAVRPPNLHAYDTCFGVVFVTARSSFRSESGLTEVPVNVTFCEGLVKLTLQDTSRYVGIIDVPVLSTLYDRFSVDCRATLEVPVSGEEKSKKGPRKPVKIQMPRQCNVRLTIYGLMDEMKSIGDLLSDAGLCFQHPSSAEHDHLVPYYNPHYLLRPGSKMPNLQSLSIGSGSGPSSSTETYDDISQSRFMRIFDTQATGETTRYGETVPVEQSPRLITILKPHQLTALAMMAERECGMVEGSRFPTIWTPQNNSDGAIWYRHRITMRIDRLPRPTLGGILADEMGLGKTLSMLALICWSLDALESGEQAITDGQSRSTLIVAPKSALQSWQQQLTRHIHPDSVTSSIYHGSGRTLPNTHMVLTTFETMRSDWATKGPLYSGPWLRVVLDEAHHIRTRSSQVFQAASAIEARYRWCLTGTPIHNSLDDYGALLSFLRIHPFIEKRVFDFWIASPIKKSQTYALRKLEDLVRATCLRRTKTLVDISAELPSRTELVQEVELSSQDREMYTLFKRQAARVASGVSRLDPGATDALGRDKGSAILRYINVLRLICNHGEHLLPSSALLAWQNGQEKPVQWDIPHNALQGCRCSASLEGLDNDRLDDDTSPCGECQAQSEVTKSNLGWHIRISNATPSAKVSALLQNLGRDRSSSLGRKSVVFSFWTKMLDLVQQALKSNGYGFERIDGQSNINDRIKSIQRFNEDDDCVIMLASIGSAAEGIDLTAAATVHLLEPHWNPMVEDQAAHRVHRIGQTQDVTIIRYVTPDSIETYVQWMQEDKRRMISRSLNTANASQSEIDERRLEKLRSFLRLEEAASDGIRSTGS